MTIQGRLGQHGLNCSSNVRERPGAVTGPRYPDRLTDFVGASRRGCRQLVKSCRLEPSTRVPMYPIMATSGARRINHAGSDLEPANHFFRRAFIMTVTTRARVWLGGTMIAMLSITGLGVAASAQPAVRGHHVRLLLRPRVRRLCPARSSLHSRRHQSGRDPGHHPPDHLRERLDDQGAAPVELHHPPENPADVPLRRPRLDQPVRGRPLHPPGTGRLSTSAKNLWPEYGHIPNPKDAVENAAKKAVCGGHMSLVAAQRAMVANWITFGRQLHAIH